MNYNYSWIILGVKMSFHFCDKTEFTESAASAPFFLRIFACFIFKQVIIPLPIGFLLITDKSIIAFVEAWDMKSKWGVWPFITQPRAKKASYFLIFFDIVTGISKTPGTLIILTV